MSLDFSGMDQTISSVDSNVQSLMQSDLTNPENLFKIQQQMVTMQTEYGSMSAILSDYKSAATSIIEKI
jgi:hypothetical protein